MEKKTYKARMELGIIVEFNVDAVYDDEAEMTAAEVLRIDSQNVIDTLKNMGYRVPNADVRCIEVEEYEPENE